MADNFYKAPINPVILITGGTGFAGSHLVELLLTKKEKNIHVTTHSGKTSFTATLLPSEQIHKIDLQDAKATNRLIKELQPDQIYHLASIAQAAGSFDRAQQTLINNVGLHLNLIQAVQKFSPKTRILTVTSADQYAPSTEKLTEKSPIRPGNPYGVSKATQDMLAGVYAQTGLDIVIARPFNHIGERQGLGFAIPEFASQIVKIEKKQQEAIKVGNLESFRDFTDVKDIVTAYHLIINQAPKGEVYNIGSGKPTKMIDVLRQLVALSKAEILIQNDPTRMRPSDNPHIVADNSKIKKLGWKPQIPLEKTLQNVLNYWREATPR